MRLHSQNLESLHIKLNGKAIAQMQNLGRVFTIKLMHRLERGGNCIEWFKMVKVKLVRIIIIIINLINK
jgi:hypothetical protein